MKRIVTLFPALLLSAVICSAQQNESPVTPEKSFNIAEAVTAKNAYIPEGVRVKKFGFGGNINVNINDIRTNYTGWDLPSNADGTFQIVLKPKFYWMPNEKMQLGGRVGFSYGHLIMGVSENEQPSVGKAIGWNIGPYYSYRLLQWKRLGVWIEANLLVGQYYNIDKGISLKEWNKMTEYGVHVLPVLDIYLTEGYSLQFHLGFISLMWYGTTTEYDNRTEVASYWDLRKGGFDGLLSGFRDYGIGLVKRF